MNTYDACEQAYKNGYARGLREADKRTEILHFTIPLPPVTKKNSQRIHINAKTGRRFISPSAQYKAYEQAALLFVPRFPTIDYCINLRCLFYMPTHRVCDSLNLLEAIDDILVKARMIKDDNCRIVATHDGSLVLYDKENPRTEVFIEKWDADIYAGCMMP